MCGGGVSAVSATKYDLTYTPIPHHYPSLLSALWLVWLISESSSQINGGWRDNDNGCVWRHQRGGVIINIMANVQHGFNENGGWLAIKRSVMLLVHIDPIPLPKPALLIIVWRGALIGVEDKLNKRNGRGVISVSMARRIQLHCPLIQPWEKTGH